MLIVDD